MPCWSNEQYLAGAQHGGFVRDGAIARTGAGSARVGCGITRAEAGTARDEGNAGPAGHRSVRAGHVGDAAFLAAGHDIDRIAPMQRVENGEEAFARDGEDTVAALFDQAVDEQRRSARSGGFTHAAAITPQGLCWQCSGYSP